jgi:hypothetical protein
MQLPAAEHTSRPWRIHGLVQDFTLEDVWALPTPGGPGDFGALVRMATGLDPAKSSFAAARLLFGLRWKLGELLGWDASQSEPTLSDRLPEDLRRQQDAPHFRALPFTTLYLLENEFAAEIANRTMHGVLHLGWVEDGADAYRGQMAVLVKRNGLLGTAYMAAIKPFRHLIVYPPMIREFGRAWQARGTVRPSWPTTTTSPTASASS